MGDLHIHYGGGLPDDDPFYGLTPLPFSIKIDYRCMMPYRVFGGRYDYDQMTTWEVGRFSRRADADLFCAMYTAMLEADGAVFYTSKKDAD